MSEYVHMAPPGLSHQVEPLPPGTAMVTVKIQREGYETITTSVPVDIAFAGDGSVWPQFIGNVATRAWDKQEREGKL